MNETQLFELPDTFQTQSTQLSPNLNNTRTDHARDLTATQEAQPMTQNDTASEESHDDDDDTISAACKRAISVGKKHLNEEQLIGWKKNGTYHDSRNLKNAQTIVPHTTNQNSQERSSSRKHSMSTPEDGSVPSPKRERRSSISIDYVPCG